MTDVMRLPTRKVKDSESIDEMVTDFIAAHKAGEVRSGFILYFGKDDIPRMLVACTTLSDEAYAISLLQRRMMNLLDY